MALRGDVGGEILGYIRIAWGHFTGKEILADSLGNIGAYLGSAHN